VSENNIVKRVCKELGVTQKELAEKIGVAEQTVRGWSSGKELPAWAEKSFELLIENSKNNEIIDLMKKLSKLLSER
jgi:transcriptional regulator with XRE-family HTH domain